MHGGVFASLLDSALNCAIHSTLPVGVGYTTLKFKISFVNALTMATGLVSCEGTVLSAGWQAATAEGRLFDASGKLYAHGTTTCLLLRTLARRPSRRVMD